jgi:hypothetical protein
MSNGKNAQMLQDTGIVREITCPQAFVAAKKVPVFPAEYGGYCTSHTIRIYGCQPGCFR